jgi:hypothetical protein
METLLKGIALRPVALTPQRDLKTLVENRTVFNFNNCELNIFETHQTSEQVLPAVSGHGVYHDVARQKSDACAGTGRPLCVPARRIGHPARIGAHGDRFPGSQYAESHAVYRPGN